MQVVGYNKNASRKVTNLLDNIQGFSNITKSSLLNTCCLIFALVCIARAFMINLNYYTAETYTVQNDTLSCPFACLESLK